MSTGVTAVSGGAWGGCQGYTTLTYHSGTFYKTPYSSAGGSWHTQLSGSACGDLPGSQWGGTVPMSFSYLWRRNTDGTTSKMGPYSLVHYNNGHKCFYANCKTYYAESGGDYRTLDFNPATKT